MDERVQKLKTPEECRVFARNATERGRKDLAQEAVRREIELRAATHGTTCDAEREAIQGIYEEALSLRNGRRTRAGRTWPMFKKHGILGTIELVVRREEDSAGYRLLVQMGLPDLAFESIVVRHPERFAPETVESARQRLDTWKRES